MEAKPLCAHLSSLSKIIKDEDYVCPECVAKGDQWVHLRVCQTCGHVGCCDNSPNRHATGHWKGNADHPLIRSYEPGEDWWWCYPEELFFDVPGAAPAPSHP
jgi:hypothetical protein